MNYCACAEGIRTTFKTLKRLNKMKLSHHQNRVCTEYRPNHVEFQIKLLELELKLELELTDQTKLFNYWRLCLMKACVICDMFIWHPPLHSVDPLKVKVSRETYAFDSFTD